MAKKVTKKSRGTHYIASRRLAAPLTVYGLGSLAAPSLPRPFGPGIARPPDPLSPEVGYAYTRETVLGNILECLTAPRFK